MQNQHIKQLLKDLHNCPPGDKGWREFERLCVEILTFLLVPPLTTPKIQPRTFFGTDRRDAIFPNRNRDISTPWGLLYNDLGAKLVLFEFKNFGLTDIAKDEVNQTRNYLKGTMGRLAILLCNKEPNDAAYRARNTIFTEDKKVILIMTKKHLKEMVDIKERGEDPADLILDMVDEFYLQHE